MTNKKQTLEGLVVAAYGKRYEVELNDKTRISCVTRGKKNDLACGDIVNIQLTDQHEGVVESYQTRHSLLYRSNQYRSKVLAANVTQAVIVLATQPSFYEALLNRCLIATEAANIKALIVLNKCDLEDRHQAKEKLKIYEAMGYPVIHTAAKSSTTELKRQLLQEKSILVGQSGMGKSTIINNLLPGQNVRTQEVSQTLDSGKHTTTAAHLYHLDAHSAIIDSPGLQEFGLNHLSIDALESSFVEFRPFLGKCRFNNCKHCKEPDCAVIEAKNQGTITATRLEIYHQLLAEIN